MNNTLVDVERNDSENLSLYVDLSDGPPEYSAEVKAQIALEEEMHQNAVDKFLEDQDKQQQTGTASNTVVFNKLVSDELENVVSKMKSEHELLKSEVKASQKESQSSPELLKVVTQIVERIGYDTMALIGLNETINYLSFSPSRQPFETALLDALGESIDFQSFLEYINDKDPALVSIISRFYLKDRTKRQRKRIELSVEYADQFEHIEWKFLDSNEKARISHWIKECVFNGTGYFESFPTFRSSDKKTRYVILLTDLGEAAVDKIVAATCMNVGNSYPMIAPPLDWKRNSPGGYYLAHPGQRSMMIHNSANTIPSQLAIDSLNNLQQVRWTVNDFILDVQTSLSKCTTEIGAFRTYEPQTYRAQHPILINPEIEELNWDEASEDPELLDKKKKAYGILKQSEKEESSTANKAIATVRALEMAEKFRNHPYFMLPWYFDNRLRQYCLVDTLNPQGSDNTKALIKFYDGTPKSDESYRDILISIATTYGRGLDKKPYDERIESAKQMVPIIPVVCKDPLSTIALDFWTKAEEPFQFLALIKEYNDVFITGTQSTHHVSTGRDATCSGIQLAGALLRDSVTCHLVNVTPSDTVQDAYKAVADEAIKLLQNETWLANRIEKREMNRAAKTEKDIEKSNKRLKEGLPILREIPPYEPRYTCELPLDLVDRAVAKMVVMLTPYGGQYPTMLEHVVKKMKKKGSTCPYQDYTILTHALIEGMNTALPGFTALNVWFKELAKATLESGSRSLTWTTPTNSVIQQEYFEDETKTVRSYVHGSKKIRHNSHKTPSSKTIKERKMQTALAANTIHSLDASLLQLALHDYQLTAYTTVHDCVYAPSGALEHLTMLIRKAFVQVVEGPFLSSMLESNSLSENVHLSSLLSSMMHEDDGLIESIIDSKYLFS